MTRTNIILFGVLLGVMAAWVAGRESTGEELVTLAPRLFPKFNPEYVDAIEIKGGWQDTHIIIQRKGTDWVVASAGDYPANADAAKAFIDAVANLRRDTEIGDSEDLRKTTHTDLENGRIVRLYGNDEILGTFVVGRSPKGASQDIFVRMEDETKIFRTRTILTKDRAKAIELIKNPMMGSSVRGFEWHNYVNKLSTRWIKTDVWKLEGEVKEMRVTRMDEDPIDVTLTKQADDKWMLKNHADADAEPVPGDADAVEGILSPLRSLRLFDIVGLYDNEKHRVAFGLQPSARLVVLTLHKEVEEEKKDGDGDAKDDEKKDKEKKVVPINRIFEVGKKIKRKTYDPYADKFGEEEYYCVRIGPRQDITDPDELERTRFIFLVNSYGVDPLAKKLSELMAKAEEEEKKDDPEKKDDADGETKDDESSEPKKDADDGENKDEESEPKKDEEENTGDGG